MFSIEYLDQTPALIEALELKKELYLSYERVTSLSADQNSIQILKGIMKDEENHYQRIAALYEKITGCPPVEPKSPGLKIDSYDEGINNVLLGELDVLDIYRKIYLDVQKNEIRDLFFDIIMDELTHALKLNWLYAKNK